jgi:hypothetical protein
VFSSKDPLPLSPSLFVYLAYNGEIWHGIPTKVQRKIWIEREREREREREGSKVKKGKKREKKERKKEKRKEKKKRKK